MARIIIDFTVCCPRDEIYMDNRAQGPGFAAVIAREVAACFGRPADMAFYNREPLGRQIEAEVESLVTSGCTQAPDRTWKDVIGDLVSLDETASAGEDDLVIIMPFQGVVTRSRLKSFLEKADPDRISLSTRVTAVNKNPFWLYGIYPEFRENNLVRDVNLTKLPCLREVHFIDEVKRELPCIAKLKGSHDLPSVYEKKDAFARVPADRCRSWAAVRHTECEVVVPDPGSSKPHIYYMLPILNCHHDLSVSFGGDND